MPTLRPMDRIPCLPFSPFSGLDFCLQPLGTLASPFLVQSCPFSRNKLQPRTKSLRAATTSTITLMHSCRQRNLTQHLCLGVPAIAQARTSISWGERGTQHAQMGSSCRRPQLPCVSGPRERGQPHLASAACKTRPHKTVHQHIKIRNVDEACTSAGYSSEGR